MLSATVLHAALPTEPDVSGRTSFAGELLIASPEMHEPFDHAVVLVAQHDRGGALGIVINRPIDSRPIASMLESLGADASGANQSVQMLQSVQVFRGGPVAPGVALALHSADYHSHDTLDIDGRIALSNGTDVLRDIALGKGPHKSLVVFGYAGWAPLQLDDEMKRGAWVAVPEDPALVFDDDRAKVWTDALALYKTHPE